MADTKVSALTAVTPAGADTIYLVDATDSQSKKATVANLLNVARTRVMLSEDESRTSTTTYANVTEFTWNLENGAIYRLTGVLFVTGNSAASTGEAKFQWSAPAGTHLGYWYLHGPAATQTAVVGGVKVEALGPTTPITGLGSNTNAFHMPVHGIIETVAAGNWVLQFAQNTSDGTATVLEKYSWIEFERIG
jgi:hypothetical protein